MTFDKIIFGAGLYGLYAALQCGRRGQRVLVLERDAAAALQRCVQAVQSRAENDLIECHAQPSAFYGL